MLPRVSVNISEEVLSGNASATTFVPGIILKANQGPIGTPTLITSERAFVDTFGVPDVNTPAAFAVRQYVKTYGNAYVCRVAHSDAEYGSCNIQAKVSSTDTTLVQVKTAYKTDSYNGEVVSLELDSTNNKLWLQATINSTLITSIKETINYSTATADVLETVLEKLVNSFNESQAVYVLENKWVGKVVADTMPTAWGLNDDALKGTVASGVSGNTGITDTEVNAVSDLFDGEAYAINAILAPEFGTVAVLNHLADLSANNTFIAIGSVSANSVSALKTALSGIKNSENLALYYPDVAYSDYETAIPASIACLPAYINTDISSQWLAPAGVTRGTLGLVTGLKVSLSESDMSGLYTNDIPVNCIKRIPGTGYVVWGQKTTLVESTQFLDRINVVRLVKYVSRQIEVISYQYLFEPITTYVYKDWTAKVSEVLERVKVGNGLDAYQVKMDDTLNTPETKKENKLIGQVKIRPLEAAEYIEVNFIVTDTVTVTNTLGGNINA